MLTLSSGHSAEYLTGAVATGRENYYTGAVAAGEPPGRWYGRGAQRLGLVGLVDTQDMTALYERFIDPRDDAFRDPARWDEAETLGHTGRRYLSEDEIYAAAVAAEPHADAERRAALRVEAGKKARKNVAFVDATFSAQKSVTVLHAALEAQEVRARRAAEEARSALAALGAPAGASGGASAGALAPAGTGSSAGTSAGTSAGDGGVRAVHITAVSSLEAERLTEAVAAAEAEAAAWAEYRVAVEDAIWAGNTAALEYLADKAGYSRVGHHGGAAGRWIDAHDWTVASFFQHDSRNHDPQLHIHNAVLNRVEGADGEWRTIDARAMYRWRGAASAVGERVMEEHLTRALGVRFAMRPDGNAREIVGIDQKVMDLFSSRRRAITRKTADLVKTFETKFGRAPNTLELDRLQRSATFATRNVKSHEGETVEQRLARWDTQLRSEVAGGLRQVADDVLALGEPSRSRKPDKLNVRAMLEEALAVVQEDQAAWTASDLTRAISNTLPDHLGHLTADQISRLLDGLTAEGLKLAVPLHAERPAADQMPDELRLADGTSAYQSPGAALYATPTHLRAERVLAAAAVARGAVAMNDAAAERFLSDLTDRRTGSGRDLGADQGAALRGILTSGAKVEALIGPAGTGKSFVVGALAQAWQDPDLWNGTQRRVVGLATSQIATDVLVGEGLIARNISRWLATQDRLADGSTHPDDHRWRLRAGDLVVVDESAMTATADLARIHTYCRDADAKLLLVGDHRQLAAVGAAGGMELVTATGANGLTGAARHELVETRRFAAAWEGPASLRLRVGDQTVLGDYHKHGRLIDGGAIEQTEQAAARAWLADTLQGRHSLLIVDTNEQAARLSAQLRADLVRLGKVSDEHSVPLGLQGTWAGRGDLIQARRNQWDLAGVLGNTRGPINREQYRVLDTLPDGGLVVAPITRTGSRERPEGLGARMTLPASYVAEHVALGYASTVHAAQGLTVDTCHTVATTATGVDALYVGLTRGRHANTAHVVTRAVAQVPDGAPTGAALQAVHRTPQAVLAGAFETADPQLSALAEASQSAAEAATVRTPVELFADAAELATAGRAARWLDQLVDDGRLTEHQRARLAAEDGAGTLATLLRRVELAGHDPRQVLTDAVENRPLDDARQLTNVLHARITQTTNLDPVADTYADRIPAVDDPQWSAYLTALARAADNRQADLGSEVADEAPQWAVEALGPVPRDGAEREQWEQRAAGAAAYRELVGNDALAEALGPAPQPGQPEVYAAWRSAWRALGRPEADRAEGEMSTGQLRMRVRAYDREQAWAAPYVANELAGVRQAAASRRHDAALRAAEADADGDDGQRTRFCEQAEQAAALADVLDERIADLEAVDAARAHWYAHTAETRAAADRARAELSARQANDITLDAQGADATVTPDEWLAAHDDAIRAEDPHREITAEHDLTDVTAEREHDQATASASNEAEATRDDTDQERDAGAAAIHRPADDKESIVSRAVQQRPRIRVELEAPGPAPLDIRQEAINEPERADGHDPDIVRIPSSDETAESVRRAQRALAEMKQRQAIDAQHTADEARERDDELARWHADTDGADDRADGHVDHDTAEDNSEDQTERTGVDAGPVLELSALDD